jgi:hypothetical protein
VANLQVLDVPQASANSVVQGSSVTVKPPGIRLSETGAWQKAKERPIPQHTLYQRTMVIVTTVKGSAKVKRC